MYATWMFAILLITSFLAPCAYFTMACFTGAGVCLIAWAISEKIFKIKTKDDEFASMGINLSEKARDITKNEYLALKKRQKIIRIIGIIVFAVGLILYPLLIAFEMPYFIMLAGIFEVVGFVLFLRSFIDSKYAALKYVKFDKERTVKSKNKSTATTQQQESSILTGASAKTIDSYDSVSVETDKIENKRILGCLIGGAAGDALGYAVEFIKYDNIIKKYGKEGITSYSLDQLTVKALISDDTQMTLFTAEGLLEQDGDELQNIYHAYKNWLITQNTTFENRPINENSKLMNRPELFSARAPGNTCISALTFNTMGTVKNPINSSKGCGGVMRVSPIAFLNYYSPFELDKLAVQAAAITHGHPLGYLPAALLVHILHKAIYENKKNSSLHEITTISIKEFSSLFSSAPHLNDLLDIVNKAIELSGNRQKDVDNIRNIGEGWVAEETLAIAIYCALRYQNDFSAAMVAAVNHDGDSDSTGAVTGNILGAYLGEDKIDYKWKDHLELYDLIVRVGKRFCN